MIFFKKKEKITTRGIWIVNDDFLSNPTNT